MVIGFLKELGTGTSVPPMEPKSWNRQGQRQKLDSLPERREGGEEPIGAWTEKLSQENQWQRTFSRLVEKER